MLIQFVKTCKFRDMGRNRRPALFTAGSILDTEKSREFSSEFLKELEEYAGNGGDGVVVLSGAPTNTFKRSVVKNSAQNDASSAGENSGDTDTGENASPEKLDEETKGKDGSKGDEDKGTVKPKTSPQHRRRTTSK